MVGSRELVLNKGSHQLPGDRVAKCGGCASCDVLESRDSNLCLPPPPPLPASTLCFILLLSPSHPLCASLLQERDGGMAVRCQRGDGWSLLVSLLPPLFFLSCSSPFSLLTSSSSPSFLSILILLSSSSLPSLPFFFTPLYLLFPSSASPLSSPVSTSPFFLPSILLPPLSSSSFSPSSEQPHMWRHPPHPQSPGLCLRFGPLHPSLSPQPITGASLPARPPAVFRPKTLRHPSAASPQGRG